MHKIKTDAHDHNTIGSTTNEKTGAETRHKKNPAYGRTEFAERWN